MLIVCLKLFGLVKNERNFSSNANQQIIQNDKQLKVAEIVWTFFVSSTHTLIDQIVYI